MRHVTVLERDLVEVAVVFVWQLVRTTLRVNVHRPYLDLMALDNLHEVILSDINLRCLSSSQSNKKWFGRNMPQRHI